MRLHVKNLENDFGDRFNVYKRDCNTYFGEVMPVMGRGFLAVVLVVILFLVGMNFYTYVIFSQENLELKNKLMLRIGEYNNLEQAHNSLQGMYNELRQNYERLAELNKNLTLQVSEAEEKYQKLINSYHEVLEANRELARALEFIANKLIVPCNYTLAGGPTCIENNTFTLMSFYEFINRSIYAYDKEMKEYVYSVTDGWDGSEEDFRSDLYKIYEAWRKDFNYMLPSPAQKNLTFIVVGTWWYPPTKMGDHFLKEVKNYDVMNTTVVGAPISFRYKKGVCWDYATVLVALYYAYYDIAGRSLPTGYLSIGLLDMDGHHGCTLIKESGDRVAIIDWEVITKEDNKIVFIPFEEAKKLHEEYWNSRISYDAVQRRTVTSPFVINNFTSNEEFHKWLIEEFN